MSNHRTPTVSMQLVRLTGQHLAGRGVDAETFRRQIGVSDFELSRQDGRLDLQRYRHVRRLVEACGRIEDFDQRPPGGWVGWVGHGWPDMACLWFNATSLGAAIQSYARYRPLIGEADTMACEADDDRVVLHCTPTSAGEPCASSTISHFLMIKELAAHYRERVGLADLDAIRIG